jgi:hypothetical protein
MDNLKQANPIGSDRDPTHGHKSLPASLNTSRFVSIQFAFAALKQLRYTNVKRQKRMYSFACCDSDN